MKDILTKDYYSPIGLDENRERVVYKKTRGKDNNGAFIGRNQYGHGNICKVRYPSKKRSRQVWRKFYALFPYLAIKDNFDGKTSNRMK